MLFKIWQEKPQQKLFPWITNIVLFTKQTNFKAIFCHPASAKLLCVLIVHIIQWWLEVCWAPQIVNDTNILTQFNIHNYCVCVSMMYLSQCWRSNAGPLIKEISSCYQFYETGKIIWFLIEKNIFTWSSFLKILCSLFTNYVKGSNS